MKILITGGAGYIGSIVTELCLEAGEEVTVFDNLSTGHLGAVGGDAELILGDTGDRELLGRTMRQKGIDAVIHMAGYIEAGESMRDPGKYFRNNTCQPLGLLDAMVDAGVEMILFSSTAAVYGDPVTEVLREDHPLKPTNAYGESKLMFERLLDWYDRLHGIRHAALRYFNAAGATSTHGEAHEPESHLVPLVLRTAMGKQEHIEIFGTDYPTPDGTCIRDYIHVLDLARAHLLALKKLAGGGESLHFNLGNGAGYSVYDVIETAREVTGREIRAKEAPRRAGDPVVLVASSDRIAAALNWRPEHPRLAEIIGSAWDWYQEHPDGYR